MKLNDFVFKEDVSYGEMLVMASNVVESICGDLENRLNRVLGREYLFLQGAVQLFTNYTAGDNGTDVNEFMELVFSYGADRFEEWLRNNAGMEKYDAFKRMVERGTEYYLDKGALESFVDEAAKALNKLNQLLDSTGEMTPETAAEMLKLYIDEQKEETPPQE